MHPYRRRNVSPAFPPPGAIAPGPGASRASLESEEGASFPLRNRGHGGQNAFHIAAGLEPEMRAAVIKQVELDIAAAPLGLFMALFHGPAFRHAPADDLRLDVEKGFTHAFGECEVAVP